MKARRNLMAERRGGEMEVVKVGPRHQVTIPKVIFEKLRLAVGDHLQVELRGDSVHMIPVKHIPRTQSWFWTKEWQSMEKEADRDIAEGRVKEFESVDDLVRELDS